MQFAISPKSFIMHSYFMIYVLSIVVSALNWDLTSPFNDDRIFQDTNNLPLDQTELLSFNQLASLFDEARSSEDSNFSVPSSFESLFQDTSNNDNLFSVNDDEFLLSSLPNDGNGNGNSAVFDGNPLEIAICPSSSSSTLEDFPAAIGKKSRFRRRDGFNGICKTSNEVTTGSFSSSSGGRDGKLPDLTVPKTLFTSPGAVLLLTADMTDNQKNRYCHWFTEGLLPYGVCSSGEIADERMSITDALTLPPFGQFAIWTLTHGTLGMFLFTTSCIYLFNSVTVLKFSNSYSFVRLMTHCYGVQHQMFR